MTETLTRTGITVNCVLPGPTASEGVSEFVAHMAAEGGVDAQTMKCGPFATAHLPFVPQRFAGPDKVASLIIHVCRARLGDHRCGAEWAAAGYIRSR